MAKRRAKEAVSRRPCLRGQRISGKKGALISIRFCHEVHQARDGQGPGRNEGRIQSRAEPVPCERGGGVLEAAGAEAFSLKTRWKGARGITEKLGINQG